MWNEPTPEEEDEIIRRLAEAIYKYDMDLVAILFLESIKPLASVGGQLARYMVAPFVPFVGEKSIPYLATLQRKENVEKLIRQLEERSKQDEVERRKKKEAGEKEGGGSPRKGWRRLLPF
jgi:acyl-CoA reductase-like NAD-dependent aldehyde dehydrogenase